MNLPKPTDITAATSNRYAAVWTRLFAAAQHRHKELQGIAIAARVVDDLIESKPSIKPNTFRQYKAAVLHILSSLAKRPSVADRIPSTILSAIGQLEATSSDGCMRKSDRTSARKAKQLPLSDFEAIEREIRKKAHLSVLAQPTLSAMTVLRLTGARPCELLSIEAHSPATGTIDVTIRNAKTTNGRGLGITRSFQLRDATEEEVAIVCGWPSTLDELVTRFTVKSPITDISKYFSRAARRALEKRRKHPTLYSLRHQFAADAKAAGLPPEEIAALMGHASDATAMRHYGRRTSGQGGIKAYANPNSINNVRRKAKRFPSGNSPKAI